MINYYNILTIVLIFIYLAFFVFQPHVAIQGILSSVGIVLAMHFVRVNLIFGKIDPLNQTIYTFITSIIILISLFFSLVQNIATIIEKRINKKRRL